MRNIYFENVVPHGRRSNHAYTLEVATQRVYDYAGEGYVHRLIQNKTDGKVVEVRGSGERVGGLSCNELPCMLMQSLARFDDPRRTIGEKWIVYNSYNFHRFDQDWGRPQPNPSELGRPQAGSSFQCGIFEFQTLAAGAAKVRTPYPLALGHHIC